MRWLIWLWRELWPPALFFALFVMGWSAFVSGFDIKPLILPGPMRVLEAATENQSELLSSTWLTAKASLLGLLASLVIGTMVAMLFASSGVIRRGGYPYAIFLQTVPIIAIAPLIVIWFGPGLRSVVIVSFILSVFPIITNATTGLLSADTNLEELFRLHNASWLQTLIKLRLPSAVPFILAGLKIGVGAAVIGALVGEFFVGFEADEFGLGYLIRRYQDETTNLFAAVLASTLLGVAMFALASGLSRLVLSRWFGESTTV
ncbi:MAG: ABC transporter permease [Planctomycetaceae bacterium]